MQFKKILQALALCGGLIGFGGANASPVTMLFDSVGDTGSISYTASRDGANLSATMDFALTSLSANSATFGLKISNHSTGPGQNKLTGLGIDVVSPELKSVSVTGSTWKVKEDTTFPLFGTVDLCFSYQNNSCSSNQGLDPGLFNSFSLTLTTTVGNFLTDGIAFTSPYSVNFRNVGRNEQNPNTYQFEGTGSGCTPNCGATTNKVPEPGSIALLGLGMLGVVLARRRRTRALGQE